MAIVVSLPDLVIAEQPFALRLTNDGEGTDATISLKVSGTQHAFRLDGAGSKTTHTVFVPDYGESNHMISEWGPAQTGDVLEVTASAAGPPASSSTAVRKLV